MCCVFIYVFVHERDVASADSAHICLINNYTVIVHNQLASNLLWVLPVNFEWQFYLAPYKVIIQPVFRFVSMHQSLSAAIIVRIDQTLS